MKKFLFIIGIVVLTGLVFCGGMFVGTTLRTFIAMSQFSPLEKTTLDAMNHYSVLRMLDENRVDDARAYLNVTLDADIASLGILLHEYDDQKSVQTANGVLARIARHRQKYPAPAGDSKVNDMINGFLNKALQEGQKNDKQNQPSQPIAGKPGSG